MKIESIKSDDEIEINRILEAWETATRTGNDDAVLVNHAADVNIFDVLEPLQYNGTEAYRKSWAEWRPEEEAEPVFSIHELKITCGESLAFAHCLIECGQKPNVDWVRATFCLCKIDTKWMIQHQHISMPVGRNK